MTLVQRNLKRIIDEKALVQKGVARRAGISDQMLSNIVNGRKLIRADMVPRLARAVDEPISELFRGYDEEEGGGKDGIVL